jgi:hypothetical protein
MAQFTAWSCNFGTYVVVGVNAAVLAELIVGPSDCPVVSEISLTINITNPSNYVIGVGVPTTQGVGPYWLGQAPVGYDPSAVAGGISIATAWQKPPTFPAQYLRRVSFGGAANLAMPIVLKFPRGLRLAPSSSLVVAQLSVVGSRSIQTEVTVEYDN